MTFKIATRFPAEITILGNVPTDIKTIVSSFSTLQAATDTVIITKSDQREPADLTIKTMTQPNTTQASEAAASKTITGLEAMIKISVARETRNLIRSAFNSTFTPALTTPETSQGLFRFADNSGLTVGASPQLPFKTIIVRPYVNGEILATAAQAEQWFIFPWCMAEADAQIQLGLTQQFGYSITFTAFANPNPGAPGDKVFRGNTALLPVGEYPT